MAFCHGQAVKKKLSLKSPDRDAHKWNHTVIIIWQQFDVQHCLTLLTQFELHCNWFYLICLIWVSFTNFLLLSSSLIPSSHLDFFFFPNEFTSTVQVTFRTKNRSFLCQEQFSKFPQLSSNTGLPPNLDCPFFPSFLLSLITLLNSIFISS